jgi:hypothetical protein
MLLGAYGADSSGERANNKMRRGPGIYAGRILKGEKPADVGRDAT